MNGKKLLYRLLEKIIMKYSPETARIINQMNDGKMAIPRPSIIYMKQYFKNKLITGIELGVDVGDNSESLLNELNIKKLHLIDIWTDGIYEQKLEMNKFDAMHIYRSSKFRLRKSLENNNIKNKFEYVRNRFEGDARVNTLRCSSLNATRYFDDNTLDFIYIDANHDYSFVYQDLENWHAKIKSNGIIAGHDAYLIDVLQAWIDFCNKKK